MLLSCTPAGRHTEQHDVFFAIGKRLKDLIPDIKYFLPEAGTIHVDSRRDVTVVDGFRVSIREKTAKQKKDQQRFCVNLSGCLPGSFEEHYYKLLTVAGDMFQAIKNAKILLFTKTIIREGKVPEAM